MPNTIPGGVKTRGTASLYRIDHISIDTQELFIVLTCRLGTGTLESFQPSDPPWAVNVKITEQDALDLIQGIPARAESRYDDIKAALYNYLETNNLP